MKILILILILLSGVCLQAQEAKNKFVVSGMLAHYDQISKYHSADVIIGYYRYPIDPGIEVLYLKNLNKTFSLGTGVCYQKGRMSDFIHNPYKFNFAEVSIPFLFSSRFKLDEKNGLLFTTGLYCGKTILRRVYFLDSVNNWGEIPDFDIGYYSDDVFFLDIYFSAGYSYSILQKSSISITPFIKYRPNTVWLNSFQKKLHYGVKLSYSFNF